MYHYWCIYFIATLLLLLLIETDSADKMQYNAYTEKETEKETSYARPAQTGAIPLIRPDAVIRPVSVGSGK